MEALTEQQLRAAFTAHRKPDWPVTYDEAIKNSLYARIIALHARHQTITRYRTQTGYLRRKRRQLPLVAVDPGLSQKDRASGEKPELDEG